MRELTPSEWATLALSDPDECACIGCHMFADTRVGSDPTPLCDSCAQSAIVALAIALLACAREAITEAGRDALDAYRAARGGR